MANIVNGNSGDCNSGDCNSGSWNSGSWNSGSWNSGNRNSGDCNSGNRNSGDCNSGNWNSGDCNSGDWNSGDWNKTNFSNGCFNTVEQPIYLFNKPSGWTYRDWRTSDACMLLGRMEKGVKYVQLRDMTDEEREAHPEAETTGGYLKELDIVECGSAWWRELTDEEKAVIKSIPNFDKGIFKEITGVDVDED